MHLTLPQKRWVAGAQDGEGGVGGGRDGEGQDQRQHIGLLKGRLALHTDMLARYIRMHICHISTWFDTGEMARGRLTEMAPLTGRHGMQHA